VLLPPKHDAATLERERLIAIELFRKERLEEPVERYHDLFDEFQGVIEDLLEATVDLAALDEKALDVMSNDALAQAFRYLAGPPISTDDLLVVAEASSLKPERLKNDPEMLKRIIQVIRDGLDRRRFAWVTERREPTEPEKNAAIIASAALMATQRVQTSRRSLSKSVQEQRVEDALSAAGLKKVASRRVKTLGNAPKPGEFCRESILGTRKADFLIGLWDERTLPLECKVSNSATNSVKRLNNDAAVKAVAWIKDFGELQIVPAALLSGVFKHHNLLEAQNRGLTIFWAHNLNALVDWIEKTRGQ
jgi:hypothetical protein